MKKKKVFRIILFVLLLSIPTFFAVQTRIRMEETKDSIYLQIKSDMGTFASNLDQYLSKTPSKETDLEFCYQNFGLLQKVEGYWRAFPYGVNIWKPRRI